MVAKDKSPYQKGVLYLMEEKWYNCGYNPIIISTAHLVTLKALQHTKMLSSMKNDRYLLEEIIHTVGILPG